MLVKYVEERSKAHCGDMDKYPDYESFVVDKLREADMMAAEDPVRYTHDEVFQEARRIIDESRKKSGL